MLEQVLAEETGIARGTLRDFRLKALKEGIDWQIGPKGAVEILGPGMRLLSTQFGATLKKKTAPLDIEAAEERRAGRERAVLTVTRVTKNRKVLLGSREGEEAELRIEVRDGRSFQAGIRIECEHVQEDYWRYLGVKPTNKFAE